MLRIGLSGGIGAGKSTVSATFGELGGIVVDGDVISREVVEPGTEGLAQLVEAFGEQILSRWRAQPSRAGRDRLQRRRERQTLNGIVHPLVGKRRSELIAGAGRGRRDRGGHSAAGRIPDGADVPAGHHRQRRRGSAGQAAHRTSRLQRRGRPSADRGPGHRGAAPRGRRRLARQLRQRRSNWSSRRGTCGISGSCRSRTISMPANPPARAQPGALRPVLARTGAPHPSPAEHGVRASGMRIDHIGSTAVPGLDAKDVIDIQVTVASLDAPTSWPSR